MKTPAHMSHLRFLNPLLFREKRWLKKPNTTLPCHVPVSRRQQLQAFHLMLAWGDSYIDLKAG